MKSRHHLGSISAQLYPQRYSKALGELLRKQILCAKATSMVIVIVIRARHRQHNQLTICLNVIKGKTIAIKHDTITGDHRTPGCGLHITLPVTRHECQQRHYNVYISYIHGKRLQK